MLCQRPAKSENHTNQIQKNSHWIPMTTTVFHANNNFARPNIKRNSPNNSAWTSADHSFLRHAIFNILARVVPAAQPHTSNILHKTTPSNKMGDAVALYLVSAKTSAHHDQTVPTSDIFSPKHATNGSEALEFATGCTTFQSNPPFYQPLLAIPRFFF